MLGYWTFGNKTDEGTDTASTLYDQSSGSDDDMSFVGSPPAPSSDVKLLIHSNTDIDGDTSIVDSSPSEHMISRVVGDPTYANTGGARTGMGDQGYMGIDFNKGASTTAGSSVQNRLMIPDAPRVHYWEDWSVVFWYKFINSASADATTDKFFWCYGAGYGETNGAAVRQDGASTLEAHFNYGSNREVTGPDATTDTNWHQIGCSLGERRPGRQGVFIHDGTLHSSTTTSGTGGLTGSMGINVAKTGNYQISSALQGAYIDQVIFIKGHALNSTEFSNL